MSQGGDSQGVDLHIALLFYKCCIPCVRPLPNQEHQKCLTWAEVVQSSGVNQDILEPFSTDKLNGDAHLNFQQDLVSAHITESTNSYRYQCFNDHCIIVPANSPHQNPIQNF